MSKLYTEDQLHKLIIKYRQQLTEFSFNKPTVQNLIDELTPIQIPTDEEIKQEADSYHGLESYNVLRIYEVRLNENFKL